VCLDRLQRWRIPRSEASSTAGTAPDRSADDPPPERGAARSRRPSREDRADQALMTVIARDSPIARVEDRLASHQNETSSSQNRSSDQAGTRGGPALSGGAEAQQAGPRARDRRGRPDRCRAADRASEKPIGIEAGAGQVPQIPVRMRVGIAPGPGAEEQQQIEPLCPPRGSASCGWPDLTWKPSLADRSREQ